jgi:hypothetical protein
MQIGRTEISGPGYINIYIPAALLAARMDYVLHHVRMAVLATVRYK